jgi:cytochrome oxidase assembly protein ShyY1
MIGVIVHTSGVNWQATSVIIAGLALVMGAIVAPLARWQANQAKQRRKELAARLEALSEGQTELLERTARIEGHLRLPSVGYARRGA